MRQFLLVLIAVLTLSLSIGLVVISFASCRTTNAIADDGWCLLYKGEFAEVKLEKALYENEVPDMFFVRFQIKNISNNTIGVDLSDAQNVLSPNQWGVSEIDHRRVINESRRAFQKPVFSKVLEKYKDNKLEIVSPGEILEYYIDFDGSGRGDIDSCKGNYFILTIDGRLFLTDGKEVKNISCIWFSPSQNCCTEIAIPYPVTWKKIPAGSLVLTD